MTPATPAFSAPMLASCAVILMRWLSSEAFVLATAVCAPAWLACISRAFCDDASAASCDADSSSA